LDDDQGGRSLFLPSAPSDNKDESGNAFKPLGGDFFSPPSHAAKLAGTSAPAIFSSKSAFVTVESTKENTNVKELFPVVDKLKDMIESPKATKVVDAKKRKSDDPIESEFFYFIFLPHGVASFSLSTSMQQKTSIFEHKVVIVRRNLFVK